MSRLSAWSRIGGQCRAKVALKEDIATTRISRRKPLISRRMARCSRPDVGGTGGGLATWENKDYTAGPAIVRHYAHVYIPSILISITFRVATK